MKKVGALVNLAQWYSVFTDKFYTFVKLKFGALDLALGPSTTNFHFLIVKLWYFTFCRLYEWLFPQTCLPEPISGLPSDTDQETTPKKNLHPGKSFDQQKHRVQFSQNFCCSELVDYTRSYLQTDKFGLHFGLDYNLW